MRLILVRHAETVENAAGINQGWRPGKLDALGKRQAARLARRLAREHIDVIYASDLRRVRQTLAPLRRLRPDIRVVTTRALREQNLGIYEGTRYGTMRAAAERAGSSLRLLTVAGGESIPQMARRVDRFTESVIAKYSRTGKTVCFYTHGGPIVAISLHLLGVPEERFRDWHPHNGCSHVFSVTPRGARCLRKHVTP
jgi:broad specificity phosphatase PhoE